MLYEAIRRGSEEFHNGDFRNDEYDHAFKQRCNWGRQACPSELEIESLVEFVNKWSTRMTRDIPAIRSALIDILPELDHLRRKTLLDVDLCDRSTSELIGRSFKRLANFGSRKAPTGASKMLHIIFPELFVMWDVAIRGGYGYGNNCEGKQYTEFLRRMQRLANNAISQVEKKCCVCRQDAIKSLKCDGHTLAKTLDEYNYVKFTLNDESVWKTEYKL